MEDSTLMPFGILKGVQLSDIPKQFLLNFWHSNKLEFNHGDLVGYNDWRLMEYIKNSFKESEL